MNELRVFLLGRFQVLAGDKVLEGLDTLKVQELFAYLLLNRNQSHPRETLAGVLWGNKPTSQSKKHLRQALWQLQAALNVTEAHRGEMNVLLVEPEWLRINPLAELWIDVAVLEKAFVQCQQVPGHQLDLQQAQMLQSAAALYQGDLLYGWYQDWCLFERERLQNIYLAVLGKLIQFCEVHHDYEAGLIYAEQILKYDPAHERTYRQVMRFLYFLGDRTSALRRYERCVTALKDELGVKPSSSTIQLYEQIKADQLSPTVTALSADKVTPDSMPFVSQILDRLKQIQTGLVNIQSQVQQDIQVVENLADQR